MIILPHLAQPVFLLGFLLLPFVLWWHLRQRRAAVPHPALALFDVLPDRSSFLARYGGVLLQTLALALLVLALAQPRWPDLRTRLDTEGIAILLVVDVSGSMAEQDFLWDGLPVSRLEAVQRVFSYFVEGNQDPLLLPDGSHVRFEGRPADLIGLVCFATRPETICPLTLNHSTIMKMLQSEEPRGVPGESETNLSDAIAVGLARLRTAGPRRQVMVLLTDGEHNQRETRSGWSPLQSAQIASSLDIPIYTIDAGPAPASIDHPDLLNARQTAVSTLEGMADLTGGEYFSAQDTATLVRACRRIDRLERAPIASFQYRRYHEAYPWLAFFSFVFFMAAIILERTLWRRLP